MNLNIPLAGMQAAALRQNTAASNIANLYTPGFASTSSSPAVGADAATDISGLSLPSGVDINQEIVNTISNVAAYKANAAVVRVEADLLGELLDTNG